MAVSISEILNTARSSLASQQLAIDVSGNNIANVNTQGYSRQKVSFEPLISRSDRFGSIGLGVEVNEITRVFNRFLNTKINNESERLGEFTVKRSLMQQVEQVFIEDSESGLSKAMNEFWNAWYDVANNPQGLAERSVVIGKAETMIGLFNKMDNDLDIIRRDADREIVDIVTNINSIATRIAGLNFDISQLELGNRNANDLRDKRDILVKELSEYIDIESYEDNDNMVNIFIAQGRTLVQGTNSRSLSTEVNPNNSQLRNIIWTDTAGNKTNITNLISSGKLSGLIKMRDTTILNFNDRLGRVAAAIINEVNKLHFNGYGLNGLTGLKFFNDPNITVRPNNSNTGSGSVSGSVYNIQSLSRDTYQISITSSTQFTLTNLLLNSSSGTYTFSSGNNVFLPQGFSVKISGSFQVGDSFTLSAAFNAAQDMAINTVISADEKKIAASTVNRVGDGTNAVNIARLQNLLLMDRTSSSSGSYTFTIDDFYNSIVGDVGTEMEKNNSEFTQQEGVMKQVEALRDSTSGVSLDEEMINLIKFQHAYQASARIITVVDELMQTLLSI